MACIIEWKIRFFLRGEEHFMNVLRRDSVLEAICRIEDPAFCFWIFVFVVVFKLHAKHGHLHCEWPIILVSHRGLECLDSGKFPSLPSWQNREVSEQVT